MKRVRRRCFSIQIVQRCRETSPSAWESRSRCPSWPGLWLEVAEAPLLRKEIGEFWAFNLELEMLSLWVLEMLRASAALAFTVVLLPLRWLDEYQNYPVDTWEHCKASQHTCARRAQAAGNYNGSLKSHSSSAKTLEEAILWVSTKPW